MSTVLIETVTAGLLNQINLNGSFKSFQLAGGANNQVYRVDCNGSQFCVKRYFQHANDPRDRFRTEYDFLNFTWQQGIHNVPRPFACDTEEKAALYQFIQGERFQPGTIQKDELEQVLTFFRKLNQEKNRPAARELPPASEFCASLHEHLQRVQSRVQRLNSIEEKSAIEKEVVEFVHAYLWPTWEEVQVFVKQKAKAWQIDLNEILKEEDLCLSPSDFGFHNALRAESNQIYFLDFEYAGRDDPDRMVSDFFCQPAIPVPLEFFPDFSAAIAENFPEPEKHLKRMKMLLPVYQIKWCCILMNDFLTVDSARRQFSDSNKNLNQMKIIQLEKTRQAVGRIQILKSL